MDRIDEAYVKRLRDLARECDSVGDMVGPNDFVLSNQIWALVPVLKQAARDWEQSHPGRAVPPAPVPRVPCPDAFCRLEKGHRGGHREIGE